jgi:hypothetical protein
VKLLVKDWGSGRDDDDTIETPLPWEDGITGEAEEDVGWMYIDMDGYVDTYDQLDDPYWWHEIYVRSPGENPVFTAPKRRTNK